MLGKRLIYSCACKHIVAARLLSTRACIVGAGPAGYYAAQKLLKGHTDVKVDMYDKLPVPFGLVRFGVAPDHPEVKNVINTFTQTATKFSDRCRFYGNLEIGKDISIKTLTELYDIVILSYGAESDRKLNVPGESSKGIYSAREFVGWYNGLPEFCNLAPDLSHESCVIVGQGNVALDIARLLLMPTDELAKTDICDHALEMIAESKVKTVHIVGRRGPLQVAFTIKEFRELIKLPKVRANIPARYLQEIDVKALPRPRKRITELMMKIANEQQTDSDSTHKSWHLHFLRSPIECLSDDGHISAVKFAHNRLEGADIENQRAIVTQDISQIPCGLVIRSIGYKTIPLSSDDFIPFDTKSFTVPNDKGRVAGLPGVYCSGWVKRGPVGVIATTMLDAFETANSVLEDLQNGAITEHKSFTDEEIYSFLQAKTDKQMVSFNDWEKIDSLEVSRGSSKGKPREKIVSIGEMLQVAKET